MNFLIILLITALLQIVAPWWVVAIVPFLVFLIRQTNASNAFWTGFAAIALLWMAYGFYLHFLSDGAMSDRIAGIFSLPNGIVLLLISALVGGLTGGLAGLSGLLVRRIFISAPPRGISL
ncbi:hypothetical protein [Dyadobacter fanqingshengii]|uniref:Uncharacterized protein n=1 Tax=Dyadobacter fanqingshengii TaxID=2906443 RepID=A0A9X1P5T9_9BACT|nr:hypothetical protein [Dyadobacter fanqingshengii]MCF0038455.1 hypothetical protein [Dyadobacter fanqingshengii]USJ34710.1 hypothetical protein NFI81_18595 [Dyadobacter fanqingshengii]